MREQVRQHKVTLADIANVLKTSEKNLPARLGGMKLGVVCSRCGGSGRYSFNQIDGDMCYGCRGRGTVMPQPGNYAQLLEDAKFAVAQGKLDVYLAMLDDRKFVKTGDEKIFAVWSASNAAKRNPSHFKRDQDCTLDELAARKANAKMSEAFSTWEAVRYNNTIDVSLKADIIRKVITAITEADI